MEKLQLQYLEQKEGKDYIEAGKVQDQINALLKSESSRRRQDIITKQRKDMNSLKIAHDEQYLAFTEDE
eukprot:9068254-Ditylum_brightwellii.AAC.1